MHNPLTQLEKLEEAITLLLIDQGLEVEELSLRVKSNGIISFRANIIPTSVITKSDFDQTEYDRIFQEIVGEL